MTSAVKSKPLQNVIASSVTRQDVEKHLSDTSCARATLSVLDLLTSGLGGVTIVVLEKVMQLELPVSTLDQRALLKCFDREVGSHGLFSKRGHFSTILAGLCSHADSDCWEESLLKQLARDLGHASLDAAPHLQKLRGLPKDGAIMLSSNGTVIGAALRLRASGGSLRLFMTDGTLAGTRHASSLDFGQWLGRHGVQAAVLIRSSRGHVHMLLPQNLEEVRVLCLQSSLTPCASTLSSALHTGGIDSVSSNNCEHQQLRSSFTKGRCFELRGVRYCLGPLLGEGTFAVVYEVTNDAGYKAVAKVLRSQSTDMLLVELLALVRLRQGSGPVLAPMLRAVGIACFTDGETDSCTEQYVVLLMEKAKMTLREMIQPGSIVANAIQISVAIALSLQSLHNVGLVHQDLKPENILIHEGGWPLLADFGMVARASMWNSVSRPLKPHDSIPLVGFTKRYAAPEVLSCQQGSEGISLHADIWSWAIIVLELFGQHIPTCPVAENASDVEWRAWAHQLQQKCIDTDLSPALSDVLQMCLSERARDRPCSFSKVISALTGHLSMSEVDNWLCELRQRQDQDNPCAFLQLAQIELQAFEFLHDHLTLRQPCWQHLAQGTLIAILQEKIGKDMPKVVALQCLRLPQNQKEAKAAGMRLAQVGASLSEEDLHLVLAHPMLSMCSLRAVTLQTAENVVAGNLWLQAIFKDCIQMLSLPLSSSQELLVAAEIGNLEELQRLYVKGSCDEDGLNPSHHAAQNGQVGTLKVLHSLGCSFLGTTGITAAHTAAATHQVACLKVLHDLNCDLGARDGQGQTPVHLAAIHGCTDTISLLNDLEVPLGTRRADGKFPIHLAVCHGHVEAMELLTVFRALVDMFDAMGNTPLHFACQLGEVQIIRRLFQLKCQISLPCSTTGGANALHYAVLSNAESRIDVVSLLLELRISVDLAAFDGTTALHLAAEFGRLQEVEILLGWGSVASAQNDTGLTAAHLAAMNGHSDVMKVLCDRSCPVEVQKEGKTAIHIAAYAGHVSVISALCRAKCNLESKTSEGFSVLHAAASGGHIDTCTTLLEFRALTNSCCNAGFTPLALAAKRGFQSICQTIVQAQRPGAPALPQLHLRVTCDGCGVFPIIGQRFKCNECQDYDLCEDCHGRKDMIHNRDHQFCSVRQEHLQATALSALSEMD